LFVAIELIRILVELPISVQTPPNWLANESGISTREDDNLRDFASIIATGINMATVAVFMMNADRRAIVIQSTTISLGSVLPC